MHAQPSSSPRSSLAALSRRQHGLITNDQLGRIGFTRAEVNTLVRRREIERVRRGIYRVAVVQETIEQRLLSVCLGRRDTLVSHRSAAFLHGLPAGAAGLVEITTSGDVRSPSDLIVHRSSTILPCDRVVVRGIPCTEITRTVIDLGDVLEPDVVEEALDAALTKRMTSWPRIQWRLRRMPDKGSRGAACMRAILARRRREDAACESVLETKVLSLLRDAGLPEPRRQYPILLEGGRRFRADFAYPDINVIIEAQGYGWHSGRSQWRKDILRSSELALRGWRVVYLAWEDVTNARADALKRLRRIANPELWDVMGAEQSSGRKSSS